jgi:hypothetical protein
MDENKLKLRIIDIKNASFSKMHISTRNLTFQNPEKSEQARTKASQELKETAQKRQENATKRKKIQQKGKKMQ